MSSVPVLILGQFEGILTGIRQLRRTRPLETEEIDGLRVPTLAEMARIKAWLLATRHTVRDYLDTVVLLERLGEAGVVTAFTSGGPGGLFDSLCCANLGRATIGRFFEVASGVVSGDHTRISSS